jgi:hypothetical protein
MARLSEAKLSLDRKLFRHSTCPTNYVVRSTKYLVLAVLLLLTFTFSLLQRSRNYRGRIVQNTLSNCRVPQSLPNNNTHSLSKYLRAHRMSVPDQVQRSSSSDLQPYPNFASSSLGLKYICPHSPSRQYTNASSSTSAN